MCYDYDVVIIGGGAAGLVAATGAAALGAKTALIEKNKLGGDCTWYGCIPSKSLLKSAQIFSLVKRLKEFGISAGTQNTYDSSLVMSHVRDIIKKISTHHPPEVFEKRGIKVLFAGPKFIDQNTLECKGEKISAKRFIIATGSHPMIPPIAGLKDIGYLTNENIFDLEVLPKSLAVLGGGPIGMELSLAFARLGVEVSIIEMFDRLMAREDKEIAEVLVDEFKAEGIRIYTGKKAVRFLKDGGLVSLTLEDKDKKQSVVKAEQVLVAVGRAANVQGLDLEKSGVKYSTKGVEVDATLRTSAKNIYACGDVAGPYQFSHMAEYQAIIAIGNALFPFKRKVDYSVVPWCTFTDPEVARVGLTEDEAKAKHKNIRVYRSFYSGNDRAVTDREEKGLAKVITDKKGYILGAHIVGANAGEIIHEYVLVKSLKLKIKNLSSAIHIYPTLAQVVKRSADEYYIEMMNAGWLKGFFRLMLKFLR
ncbi:MAG: dihydrolipoyl dehydrogenase [Omnitrophica WOR_2 bacterium GWF2_43_52]|nr:MAG: dihydrolipoyl dehydrogenase [Omnitrophica WOR_2 bacterium GWF2_43_52]HAH21721.1 dihydrolipoyl dehydrogenase [Candidatus Omnitrophota bacterium]HBG64732.1 dihydrolipoyl dehydrogenase [Candidatus Omnitrophota bacterium]